MWTYVDQTRGLVIPGILIPSTRFRAHASGVGAMLAHFCSPCSGPTSPGGPFTGWTHAERQTWVTRRAGHGNLDMETLWERCRSDQ